MFKQGSMFPQLMNIVSRWVGRDMIKLAQAVVLLFVCTAFPVKGEVTIFTETGSRNHLRLNHGNQIHLTCQSSDGSQVTWFHNNTALHTDDRHRLTTSQQNGAVTSELAISDAQVADSGLYVCRNRKENFDRDQLTITVAADDSEPLEKQDKLNISILEPSTFDPLERILTVDSNGKFTLKCNGSYESSLRWYHNGSELLNNHPVSITSSLDIYTYQQVSLLSRKSVRDQESGIYECRDQLRRSLGARVTVRVRRLEKATVPIEIIEPSSKSERVRVGASFEIKCKASNSTQIVWYFNGSQELSIRRDSVQIKTTLDPVAKVITSILQLENVSTRDSGRYSCRNKEDPDDNDSVTITVDNGDSGSGLEKGTPPMFPTSVTMRIGSVTNLQCSFQALGDYRQEWTKDDQILLTGDKYIIHQDAKPSSLSIRFTERSDAGIYKCTFRHLAHSKIAGIVVFNVTTIPCPPLDPPTNGHLVHCPSLPVLGESCSFGCNHGYSISNSSAIVCDRQNGAVAYWTRAIPECTAMPSNKSENDVPTTISNVLLRIGSNLTLQCGGFLVSWTKHEHVIANGSKYTVDNNSLTIKNIDRSDAGIYDCSLYKGRLLIGMNKFNVTSLACPKPPQLPHGTVEVCSDQPIFGEHCVYRCNEGYTLHGSRLRSCELMGNENVPYWTGDPAGCLGSFASRVSSTTSSSAPLSYIPTKLCILYHGVFIRLDCLLLTVVTFAQLLLPHSFHL